MSDKTFNKAEKQKTIQIIKDGSQVPGEIDDLEANTAKTNQDNDGGGSVGSGTGESLAIYVGDSSGELSNTLTGTTYARISDSIAGLETDGIKASSGQAFTAYSGDGVGGARMTIDTSAISPNITTTANFLTINPLSGSIGKISTATNSQSLKLSTNQETQSGYIQINPGAVADIIINTQNTIDFQNIPTSTTARAGTQTPPTVLPANPVGFLSIKINGYSVKVPYYDF